MVRIFNRTKLIMLFDLDKYLNICETLQDEGIEYTTSRGPFNEGCARETSEFHIFVKKKDLAHAEKVLSMLHSKKLI